jgi:trehalose-6-phosphate synthase
VKAGWLQALEAYTKKIVTIYGSDGPGTCIEDEKISNIIKQDLIAQNLYPVMLSQEEIDHFYDGFSNDTLWPLFHYFPSYANYTIEGWNCLS